MELYKSNESVLLNPGDETLNDSDPYEYDQILKDPVNRKKRVKAIVCELHSTFENFDTINNKMMYVDITIPKKRGRKPGSKNIKTIERESAMSSK
ncbi:hypothetical protein BpHYR1_004264 [Brachionus plicatilis]|uniref:Uncharacterized protein n=1 Tax=Brachionus plicatilis TaxID=10195 RepID=A0A3M7SUZ6_BRAPC|nr:hypothetical protein BpHYR1_004264 [Brachionus plicatilis]